MMLRLAGVQLHPAVRVLIGGVLIALGIVRHTIPGLVVGIVLVAWGLAAVVALATADRDVGQQRRQSR